MHVVPKVQHLALRSSRFPGASNAFNGQGEQRKLGRLVGCVQCFNSLGENSNLLKESNTKFEVLCTPGRVSGVMVAVLVRGNFVNAP